MAKNYFINKLNYFSKKIDGLKYNHDIFFASNCFLLCKVKKQINLKKDLPYQ